MRDDSLNTAQPAYESFEDKNSSKLPYYGKKISPNKKRGLERASRFTPEKVTRVTLNGELVNSPQRLGKNNLNHHADSVTTLGAQSYNNGLNVMIPNRSK